MGKADLHAHTCHDGWGDGNQTVEELFRYVEEHTDLDLFAITDHDSTEAARAAWEVHRRGSYRFSFLPGVEVTNTSGHLLCYFPDGNIVDIPSLRPFGWTVRYARERGALCVAAHPVYPPWLASSIDRSLRSPVPLHAVEVVNTGISAAAQARLDRLAGRFVGRIALVGNSDAHDRAAVGAAYTEFPGRSVDDFVRALERQETRPTFVRWPEIDPAAKAFTNHRSLTRPGWVRNVWREFRPGE
jgi:predicted metal-dependent phosphoesterase TrpH